MLKHTHKFTYEIEQSDIEGVNPQVVTFRISGDTSLPDMLSVFESYLKAVGFVPPENTSLEFV